MNTEHEFIDTNRHLVEVPDTFAVARWPRDADVATIARCILGTLKYEPHTADITVLRRALEGVIEHTARGGTLQKGEDSEPKREGWFEIQRQSGDTTMTDEENSMNKPDMPPSVADAKADQMTEEQLLAILRRRATEIQRQSGDQMTVKQWLAIRKEAGLKIDPKTAEVTWIYVWELDPYGVHPDLPEEYKQANRESFARSPGSDVWVAFGDLPAATRDALWKRRR